MGSLELPQPVNGSIEVYGATQKINDTLTENFAKRGRMAGELVLATLTETPYHPAIDGIGFGIEVSNVYEGYGDDEAATKDTVDEARDALAEFLTADVPGSRRVGLESYPTRYLSLLRDVAPTRRTPKVHTAAFEEALVETSRSKGIQVAGPGQAIEIIRRAPKYIELLRLTGNVPRHFDEPLLVDAVTLQGRIVNTRVVKRLSIFKDYYQVGMPEDIKSRGGRAPGSTIARRIEDRVVDLRTRRTKR